MEIFFLIAPFPDLCLLVPFDMYSFVLYIVRSLSGKFVDTIDIFSRKRNAVSVNISGFAKIFHEQTDETL